MVDRLSFFGLGKLGLPLAALFAESGLTTLGIDIDAALVKRLKSGEVPYVERGLSELLNKAAPAITYTTNAHAAAETDASIILVPTPSDTSSPEYSINYVNEACRDLAASLNSRPHSRYHLIVISSTVAPGTITNRITPLFKELLGQSAGENFGIAYVPDFVALGEVIEGFRNPDFLLVGSDDEKALQAAVALYQRIMPGAPVRRLSVRDAEITKMAHNLFCCMKISFANCLAQLGEQLGGADLDGITETLGLATKIGPRYLQAGAPYGGPCLPRDTLGFMHLTVPLGLSAPLATASETINTAQYDLVERHVLAKGPRSVAILGLSFKKGTPVTVGSPALVFAARFLARSLKVLAYDPQPEAREEVRAVLGEAITCCETLAEAVTAADAILVCNPEPSFAGLGKSVPTDRTIIDPWGCIKDPHPGLVRPGRPRLTSRPLSAPTREAYEPADAN
jgi:UDPglucose 6-dehydrogenase